MKIYFGCPTGERRDNIVKEHGVKFGACLTRDVFNNPTARMMHWFFDNGAYADWKNQNRFDHEKFLKRLLEIEAHTRYGKSFDKDTNFSAMGRGEAKKYKLTMPDFVVCPDKVAGGMDSLRYSIEWIKYLHKAFPNFKYYLAVQDGMDLHAVEMAIWKYDFDGIFVGGTKQFKYELGEQYVQMAKRNSLPIHCGGIGTPKDTTWAKRVGFDSVDSGIAMIHSKYLGEILNIDNDPLWNISKENKMNQEEIINNGGSLLELMDYAKDAA